MGFLGFIKNGTKGTYGLQMPAFFPASRTTYDNSQSGLSATRVQGAIDEVKNIIDNIGEADTLFNGTVSTANTWESKTLDHPASDYRFILFIYQFYSNIRGTTMIPSSMRFLYTHGDQYISIGDCMDNDSAGFVYFDDASHIHMEMVGTLTNRNILIVGVK